MTFGVKNPTILKSFMNFSFLILFLIYESQARQKNEELRKAAEEKKKEMERKRLEEDRKQEEKLKKQLEERLKAAKAKVS